MLGLMLLAAGFMHDLEGVQVAPRCLGELVQLETSTGVLFGTIDLPTTPSPWPIVLIHPGSGPTDRDGNQANLKNNSLKMLGRELASRGFATLRIDKRGIAASVKALSKETDIVPDIYCSDIAAWVEMLRRDPRFTKIAFIGHSEGSLLGLAATKKVKLDAFVSLCGPGRPLEKSSSNNWKKHLALNSRRIFWIRAEKSSPNSKLVEPCPMFPYYSISLSGVRCSPI